MGSIVQVSGIDVIEGKIYMPSTGTWTADVVLDAQEGIAGGDSIEITSPLTGFSLTGKVRLASEYIGTIRALLVGGADGLLKPATAQHYTNPTAKLVLDRLMQDGGESISSSAQTNQNLGAWTVMAHGVGTAIAALAEELGVNWRVLPDGSIFFGAESPAEVSSDYAFDVVEQQPQDDAIVIGADAPLVVPQNIVNGRTASYVEHAVTGDSFRSTIFFQAP